MDKKMLYRYRKVTEHSVDELINDELVISSLDTFNDPFDTTISHHSIDCQKELIGLKLIDEGFKKQYGTEYFSSKEYKDALNFIYEDKFSIFVENFKKCILVGCFSIIPDNPVMWAHYSNQRKGFVIGYYADSINKLIKSDKAKEQSVLMPVSYDGKMYDVTDMIIASINQNTNIIDGQISIDEKAAQSSFNSLMLSCKDETINAFLTKTKEWKYEEEVRIIKVDLQSKGNMHKSVGKCIPSCIILGDKMQLKDRYLLLSIAYNKGIPVYEMRTSFVKNAFGFRINQISKSSIEYFLKKGVYNITFTPARLMKQKD